MEEKGLMQQGVDSRAMFAVFITKLPRLLLLAVAGAVVGSGLNWILVLMKTQDICYVSETRYYIDFADGVYEARDYYNAFTWNDILSIDPILGRAIELLGGGYDRNQVETMIAAEMLSDVRYLTVIVRGQDPAQVEEIKNALATALEEYGAKMEEFTAIYKIEDSDIVLEEIPHFAWRAAFLGALLAVGVGAFVTVLSFCMGSIFYTKGDITVRLGLPVCGMTFQVRRRRNQVSAMEQKQAKMLEESLKILAGKYAQILLMDASEGQDASAFLRGISEKGAVDCSSFQIFEMDRHIRTVGQKAQDTVIVAVIPFGRTYREKIADEIDYVRQHGGRVVAAVLTQADRRWSGIYYAQGGHTLRG